MQSSVCKVFFHILCVFIFHLYILYINLTAISHDINTGTKMQAVINLMVNFARFLTRAKGDFETAEKVYRKIAEVYYYHTYICM